MWWKSTGKTLATPIGFNFEEVVYFRLAHLICFETTGGHSFQTTRTPGTPNPHPQILDYPGKLSLGRSRP